MTREPMAAVPSTDSKRPERVQASPDVVRGMTARDGPADAAPRTATDRGGIAKMNHVAPHHAMTVTLMRGAREGRRLLRMAVTNSMVSIQTN